MLRAVCLFGALGLATLAGAPAVAATPTSLHIVVMGDSYSAGNGAGDYYGPHDCFRSRGNWGERYRNWLAGAGHPATLTMVACSGATTSAITHPVPRDAESCWTGPAAPDEYIDGQCRAWLRPQVDAADATTDLVLLTIGGNDAGFSDVVLRCFVPALRSANACRSQLDHARAVVGDAGPDGVVARLVGALAAIHAKAPSARIVLLGYPYLVDSSVPYVLAGQPSLDVTPAVRDLTDRGMAAAREAVRRTGSFATFVPVADAFAGHEPEPRIQHDNPRRWITQVGDGGLAWKTWYHPNPLGQLAYRDRLIAVLGEPADNRAPVASFNSARLAGSRIIVDGRGSADPDGTIAGWQWLVGGLVAGTGPVAVLDAGTAATAEVTLRVTDDRGQTGALTRTLAVGNRAPIIAAIASTPWGADATPALYASAVDPDGDPLHYAYRLVGPSVDLSSGWVAGAWRVPPHRLDPAATYVWSVTAQDPGGASTLRAALLTLS